MALGYMRRHRKWLYVFLWIIIAAFIILYIPALQSEGRGTPGETLVSVGPLHISVGEFQRDYNRQRQMYDRLYQGRLDANMMRQLGLDQQVLEGLVTDRIVQLEAKRLGIKVSDDALARAIATAPEFQEGGRFIGTAEIRRRLDISGTSEEQFEQSLRSQLQRESLENLIGADVFPTEAEVEREFRKRTEQVKLEYVLVDAARFRAKVEPSENEIEARFEAHKEAYRIPERRVVSYVRLDRQTLQPQVVVTDHEMELYYQDHRDEFRQDEEACASHILIKVSTGAGTEGHSEAEARTIAQGLLDQIHAGADFATLARKFSEDQGTAQKGGDLGCFPPGRMVPEFDDAVFEMKPGQVSGLVKTSFGFHIIRLNSKREETVLPFAQVKERIRTTLTDKKVRELGDQKAQALSDALSHGKSLQQAASSLGLMVQKSAPIARGETPPELTSPTLLARVFQMKAGEVEKEGFQVPQGAVFVALDEVQPSHLPELKDVRDKVRSDIVEERALEEARALAASVRAKAETVGLEKAATAAGLVRKETPALTGRGQPLGDLGTGFALEQAAYSLPEKTLSEPVRLASGWAILRVLERKAFDPVEFAKQKDQITASLRKQMQQELFRAYLLAARERYQVKRNAQAWRRAIGEEQQ
jgi:peptidyl-prolyl cis-trans isomerase D